MNLKETYNKIAKDWVKDHVADTWWQEGTDKFLATLSPGAKVLDLGCGGGLKAKYMSERGLDVLGIDFSEEMIRVAKETYPEIKFQVLDIYEVDRLDEKFDGIFAQASLLHIEKKRIREVLRKLYDKLNPGGLLYVAVKKMKDDGLEERNVREDDYGYEYERFFSFYSFDELKQYFNELNLSIIWSPNEYDEPSQDNVWLQIIGKK